MLKEKALRTIKAEFKEYKQRILTNLSKEYIFEIAYQIYVKSRIYDFLIKGWEYPSEIYEINLCQKRIIKERQHFTEGCFF